MNNEGLPKCRGRGQGQDNAVRNLTRYPLGIGSTVHGLGGGPDRCWKPSQQFMSFMSSRRFWYPGVPCEPTCEMCW